VRQKELLAAQNDLEKKATAYLQALADTRLDDLRLNAAAVELKKRFGLGEISSEKIPDGITEALQLEQRTKLSGKTTAVLNTLDLLLQERDKLLRPDPAADALATATSELLTLVGSRLDLIADWKRLAADYRRERSARPASELKRVEQLAAERQAKESSNWDSILGIDSSKASTSLAELLEVHYQELIEIEEKEENIKKQREKVEQILELARKEAAAIARVLPMLAKQVQQLEAAREEDAVLAKARLCPDQADELLKAYQARTGRLLTKPLPFAEKHKAEKVEELSNLLFERHVTLEAAKRWNETLSDRLAATGIKVEAGCYQDELTKMQAVSAANVRRVNTLVGNSDGPASVKTGEIGSIRAQMNQTRSLGVKRMGITILVILLGAYFLPSLLLWTLRRALGATRGEEGSLTLTALFAIIKLAVWMSAAAVILNLLGFNVTAIIAGLGIGGLAIGLAAQSMLADAIGAVVIFVERRFKNGDVIRLDRQDPVRVAGLTWRSTQVKNAAGLLVTIPNRKVTEAVIENLTGGEGTHDALNVSVTTTLDASKVQAAIQHALNNCRQLTSEFAMSVVEFNQKGDTRTITYRCSWLTKNYDARNETRAEVFERIAAILSQEELAGAEISLV
jgi:small-conductance mechanosensitive channel